MEKMKAVGTAIAAALALLLWVNTAVEAADADNKDDQPATKALLADFKAGGEPDGFRGAKWGVALSEFSGLERSYDATIGKHKIANYEKTGDDLNVGSVKASGIDYVFSEGKFQGVSIDYDDMKDAQWQTLRDALFAEYGEVEELLLNGDPTYVWFGDKTLIRLNRALDRFYLVIWSRYLLPDSDTTRVKFRRAVDLSDLPRIEEMIEADPSLAKTADEDDGKTPLHWSIDCHASNLGEQTLELLISKGADVNAKAKDGTTPLYRAATHGQIGLVKLLVSKGADVNLKSWENETALLAAASLRTEAAEYLISKGADVTAKGYNIRTALHQAAEWGNTDLMKLLISKGADVNARDKDGWTPLHEAVSLLGSDDAVRVLLAGDADVNAKTSKEGWTPLHVAVDEYRKEAIELLLGKNASVNARDNDGITPLGYAKENESTAIVELLSKHGGTE